VREKILLIALPGIGDALLATPMVELLRKAKPDAEIHALVMFAATKEMFEHDPYVDHVHFHDFLNNTKSSALAFLLGVRGHQFDISISTYPQNRREYNLIALFLGAKRRYGITYRRRSKRNLNWLNTKALLEDDRLHCVEENVRLLSLLGIEHELREETLPRLRLNLSEGHAEFASRWYREAELDPTTTFTIGFHAGTARFKNHVNRRWSPEKFAELAKAITQEMNARVLLFGGPDDRDANEAILRLAGDHITEVRTRSIMESVAVMRSVGMFVSNDSALMHIAGALELPTVGIFGPTNETYVHPWKTRYEIVQTGIDCRPCFVYSPKPLTCYRLDPAEHYLCMRAIEVADVLAAIKRLLPVQLSTSVAL
jgi:heptosyltransferase-2